MLVEQIKQKKEMISKARQQHQNLLSEEESKDQAAQVKYYQAYISELDANIETKEAQHKPSDHFCANQSAQKLSRNKLANDIINYKLESHLDQDAAD